MNTSRPKDMGFGDNKEDCRVSEAPDKPVIEKVTLNSEVKILGFGIKFAGRSDINLSIPEAGKRRPWFTLKEGSRYNLKFTFQVTGDSTVSGLKYSCTVWKAGIRVASKKQMIGSFSPQLEPYTQEMPEEATPSGILARGSYTVRKKFIDDNNKCYMELNYTFDIRKDWVPST